MAKLTQAEMEARYDAERSGRAYTNTPTVLDVATARGQALAQWTGEIRTSDSGGMLRYPELPDVVIGHTADGTPVYGDFDNDDRPLCTRADWGGFSIVADVAGFDLGDQDGHKEYEHITHAQWAALKALVASGVVDQALTFGKAWDAQRDAA